MYNIPKDLRCPPDASRPLLVAHSKFQWSAAPPLGPMRNSKTINKMIQLYSRNTLYVHCFGGKRNESSVYVNESSVYVNESSVYVNERYGRTTRQCDTPAISWLLLFVLVWCLHECRMFFFICFGVVQRELLEFPVFSHTWITLLSRLISPCCCCPLLVRVVFCTLRRSVSCSALCRSALMSSFCNYMGNQSGNRHMKTYS